MLGRQSKKQSAASVGHCHVFNYTVLVTRSPLYTLALLHIPILAGSVYIYFYVASKQARKAEKTFFFKRQQTFNAIVLLS